MIFVVDSEFSPRCPNAMPLANLYDASAIGLYGLRNGDDESGFGRSLITGNVFDAEGMVCSTATTAKAVSGVPQPDELTVIVACNLAFPVSGGNILSNMSPAAAPINGVALLLKSDGKAYVRVGSGSASPSYTEHDVGAAAGGWTTYAVRIKAGEISSMRKAGTVSKTNFAHAMGKNLVDSLVLNGSPAASPTTGGLSGKIGLLCCYAKCFDDFKTKLMLDAAVAFMAKKGVAS